MDLRPLHHALARQRDLITAEQLLASGRVGLELDLHGWHVKRVTWRQLRHETELVAAALEQRRWARSTTPW